MYKEIQPRFPSDHSLDLGILAKNGAHGNIVKSYLELNFIRENTYKKAAVNVSETI